MKGLKFSRTVFILLLLATYHFASAQTVEQVKRVSRSFPVNASTTVDIQNKYGKVHVELWQKDSVKFIISAKIQGATEESVKAVAQQIYFDFTETPTYIIAQTMLGSQYGGIIKELKEMAKNVGSSDEVDISYKVFLPSYVNLKITNKYGDIYAPDITGDMTIRLSNGDMKANDLKGNVDFDIRFGDAVINSISAGKINLYFAELYVKEASRLNIDSKSSKITIDGIEQLKMNSKRDKYYVKKIKNLYAGSSFSDLWINDIEKEVNGNFRYGNVSLDNLSGSFSNISVTTRYTDLYMNIIEPTSYMLEIIHEETDITFPSETKDILTEKYPGDKSKKISKVNFGENTDRTMRLNSVDGSINIVHKK